MFYWTNSQTVINFRIEQNRYDSHENIFNGADTLVLYFRHLGSGISWTGICLWNILFKKVRYHIRVSPRKGLFKSWYESVSRRDMRCRKRVSNRGRQIEYTNKRWQGAFVCLFNRRLVCHVFEWIRGVRSQHHDHAIQIRFSEG